VAAKLDPDGHVHLLEDHLRSYELLKENVEENKLEKQVEVFLSDLFSSVGERTYHQIISNPPQQLGNEFLKEVVEQSFNHLKPNGELWMVVKNNVKPFMKRILEEWFGSVKIEAQSREHIVLVAKKISS
jgi:16S rRNA (guanine1207-N2)-methyltransferase